MKKGKKIEKGKNNGEGKKKRKKKFQYSLADRSVMTNYLMVVVAFC